MQRFIESRTIKFWDIPKCGVYALRAVENGLDEIVYVGQSNNIPRRLIEHYNAGKIHFTSVSWICADDPKKRSEIERYYIMKLHPKYNIMMNYARK
jgi:excinuclease UvrABC nuclease subunit